MSLPSSAPGILWSTKESKKLRLSGVHLPFWRDWSLSTNPAKFLTPEPLHHWHKQFFDHEFQWCRKILTDEEIDFRLFIIQPRVVHTICTLLDFQYFAQAPEIDEETLLRTDGSLAEFHQHKQSIIDAKGCEQEHFFIPKLEFMHTGAPIQYTADVTEKAHSTEIKVPARTETNHRDYDPQITRYLDRAEKMRLFDLATGIQSSSIDLDLDSPHTEDDGDENGPVAQLHRIKYLHLESRMFATPSTAFCLNRTPDLSRISVEEAAELFGIHDLQPSLGDYFAQLHSRQRRTSDTPLIGGHRRSDPECDLPFTHLEVWFNLRVQVMSPHKCSSCPLAAQNLQAHPPDGGEWQYGHYDNVLLCNDQQLPWPGDGFRQGLKGHTVAQIRLIMRPVWGKSLKPLTTAYLMYAQRFDVVSQSGSRMGREPSTGMYILKRATRADGSRMGNVIELENIRIPIELIAHFGEKADPRFTPYNSLECSTEVRLNKYLSKELFWILESVSL
ncbi:hypothetical protein B0H17DRAFT_1296203 [Mycena rosella]|uniref:DUF6830 domain-containing protein n=1 Tax=Mycena rosella TaxID=1033263 RepID=A0AAD7GFV0_MYCRO|nr:hypothetical protein B0H17DRAFT_1296203 [Mycena rosella]